MTIDGQFDDWPAGTVALADAHHLYLRVSVDRPMNLQSGARSVVIRLDLDDDSTTGGLWSDSAKGPRLGCELQVQFAAPPERLGVAVTAIDAQGVRRPLSHAAIGLIHAPTYAATSFELRIARYPAESSPQVGIDLASSRTIAGATTLLDGADTLATIAFRVALPPGLRPVRADVGLPGRQAGAVRVVSYNVRNAAPLKHPQPFGRILSTLGPDIVLIQEWRNASRRQLHEWLDRHLGPTPAWHLSTVSKRGQVIAARHAVDPIATADACHLAAAVVRTPIGPLAVACVHLSCCGSLDSPQERQRLEQAAAINRVVAAMDPVMSILGGDVNLVGSRRPLALLGQGLDAGGADLAVAPTLVLGQPVQYTWRNPAQVFSPGRLDYLTYSGATLGLQRAFVLDTEHLSDAALARSGLEAGDTSFSDHLPLIMDVVRRR